MELKVVGKGLKLKIERGGLELCVGLVEKSVNGLLMGKVSEWVI